MTAIGAIFGNFNLSGPQSIADRQDASANGGTAKIPEKVDGRQT